jgi:glycerol uptake operon antiterminator
MNFQNILRKNPIIAAVRDVAGIDISAWPDIGVIFMLGGTIFDLPSIVKEAHRHNKLVFADIDLVKGIGKDTAGVHFLATERRVDGIITTRSSFIKSIKDEGLLAIERMFVLDSESLNGGLGIVQKSRPDAIEVLPGLILPRIMKKIRAVTSIPVIAGGLITEEADLQEALAAGAIGASTSATGLYHSHS